MERYIIYRLTNTRRLGKIHQPYSISIGNQFDWDLSQSAPQSRNPGIPNPFAIGETITDLAERTISKGIEFKGDDEFTSPEKIITVGIEGLFQIHPISKAEIKEFLDKYTAISSKS